MNEREVIVIGYTTTTDKIVIEGFCAKGEYNTNLAKSSTSKYDRHFEIDITELTPEQIFTEYSEAINNRQRYTSILTRSNKAKISTLATRYPLKHALFLLLNPGNHVIMYGGEASIEVNITSADYYYGEEAVITSSEVTSL